MYLSIRNIAIGSMSVAALLLAGCAGGTGSTSTPSIMAQSGNEVPSLKCFEGGGGTCTIDKTGGTATLTTTAAGQYAGVYFASFNDLKGVALSQLTALQITVSSENSQPSQGSPRITLPVTYNGAGTNAYVYISDSDPTCGNPNSPVTYPDTVDGINGTFCKEMQGYSSPQLYYASWNTFITSGSPAYGSAVISGTPFFVSDQPGVFTVSNFNSK